MHGACIRFDVRPILISVANWKNTIQLGKKLFTLLSRCIVKYEPNPIGSQYHYALLLSGDCKVFSYWWHVLKICHQESFADSLYPRSLLLPRNSHHSALSSTVLGLTIHLYSKCLADAVRQATLTTVATEPFVLPPNALASPLFVHVAVLQAVLLSVSIPQPMQAE